ncbi:MAG: electron transfer flavoprotein subunit alpha/FixB family protein [Moorellales bacterium]
MATAVLVFAEHKDGQWRKVTAELLTQGRRLADQLGGELGAMLLGQGVAGMAEGLGQYGVDKVYLADDERLANYTTDAYTTVVTDLVKSLAPQLVLFGHTAIAKDLAPRVAQRLGAGLVTDCTGLELADGKLRFVRPIYAGKAITQGEVTGSPAIATVRPNVLGVAEVAARTPEVVKQTVQLDPASLRQLVKEIVKKATGRVELTEADIIVSGGRGMKGPENFKILEELADVLGAAVGASRAAVDAGWRDHADQVGQTGKTVSPTLYIACGISGAIQHLAGMISSKYIVAINKDPEAPIFQVANYGIVGDLFKIVPLLTEEFKKALQ